MVKRCLWVLVWIGVGFHGLWAAPCYGLAVIRGFWCGSALAFGLFVGRWWRSGFWFESVVDFVILVWIGGGSAMEVCGFWFGSAR